jgi:hypothetical protein
MTLRRQISLTLPFGQLVGHGQHFMLTLDAWLCVAIFRRFCFYRQSGDHGLFSFRPITLRRRVFPVLLFIGAVLLSRIHSRDSIRQAF